MKINKGVDDMSWLAIIMICATGIIIMDGKGTETKKEIKKYSKEYCRNNLSARYYDNWNCEDIAYQLQDNWVKDELEYLLKRGYSFERSIDELVEKGKITL